LWRSVRLKSRRCEAHRYAHGRRRLGNYPHKRRDTLR
jgi:hypothetical protein